MTQASEFPHDQLREEVRLLGALLGEVIRDEGGQALYDRIEAVRRASVAYHRDPATDGAVDVNAWVYTMDYSKLQGILKKLTDAGMPASLLGNVGDYL